MKHSTNKMNTTKLKGKWKKLVDKRILLPNEILSIQRYGLNNNIKLETKSHIRVTIEVFEYEELPF